MLAVTWRIFPQVLSGISFYCCWLLLLLLFLLLPAAACCCCWCCLLRESWHAARLGTWRSVEHTQIRSVAADVTPKLLDWQTRLKSVQIVFLYFLTTSKHTHTGKSISPQTDKLNKSPIQVATAVATPIKKIKQKTQWGNQWKIKTRHEKRRYQNLIKIFGDRLKSWMKIAQLLRLATFSSRGGCCCCSGCCCCCQCVYLPAGITRQRGTTTATEAAKAAEAACHISPNELKTLLVIHFVQHKAKPATKAIQSAARKGGGAGSVCHRCRCC